MKLFALCFSLVLFISYSHANTSKATEIKLLSWNIFMIPKPFNFTKQTERTPLIANHLKTLNADIVVLQECFSENVRNYFKENLKEIYPYMVELGKSKKFYQFLTSGLFILSKYPIKTLAEIFYKDCNTTDCFGSKGFILTEIKISDNSILQLGATHLQAWDTDESKATRLSQINQMNDTLKTFKHDNVPQILAGDFNVDLNTEERSKLFSILNVFDPVTDNKINYTSGEPNACFHVPGKGGAKKWIDYVLTVKGNKNATIKSTEVKQLQGAIKSKNCDLSDHFAIESRIAL